MGPWGVTLPDLCAGKITGDSHQGGVTCARAQGLWREEPERWACLSSVAAIFVYLLDVGTRVRWLSLCLGDGSDSPERNGHTGQLGWA